MARMGLCGGALRLPMTPLAAGQRGRRGSRAARQRPARPESLASNPIRKRRSTVNAICKIRRDVAICARALRLRACSSLESDKIDYKSAGKGADAGSAARPDPAVARQPLRGARRRRHRQHLPGRPGQAPAVPTAASTLGDVRIERAGTQRWLVVNRSADQLWGPVRDFWQESGFLLTMDQRNLGIMETDWAENRAKIPQDIIRSTLGKLIDSVYSTAELDRFRTRMERTASGGTEIYISHRGMEEVYSNTRKDQTIWQPRPADPELEAEFLRRLMVKLGVLARAVARRSSPPARAARPPRASRMWAASRWCRSTKASTAHGAASAWRWTAPASRWKTATAPRAPTSCATSRRTRTSRTRASSASCSARLEQDRGAAEVPHQLVKSQGEIDHRVGAQRQRRTRKPRPMRSASCR